MKYLNVKEVALMSPKVRKRWSYVTIKGVNSFAVGLGFNFLFIGVAMIAVLVNAYDLYDTSKKGDMLAIILRLSTMMIIIQVISLICYVYFITGIVRFFQGRHEHPESKQHIMVYMSLICFIVLTLLFTFGLIVSLGLIPPLKEQIKITGSIMFVLGGLAYGLFFTLMIFNICKAKPILLIGMACIIVGGILFGLLPVLLPILAFMGNLFFMIAYIHTYSLMRHELEDVAEEAAERLKSGRKDLEHGIYRKASLRHGRDADFDVTSNPYTVRRTDGTRRSQAEIRQMFREKPKGGGPKEIRKKIPKDMRYSNCPLCGAKLPPSSIMNKCPSCKEVIFD